MLKDLFMGLSQNQLLNSAAKKYGLKLGAQNVVAGTNIEETIKSIKELNSHGISCTVDNLGEFVYEKEEATEAKEQILKVIDAIHENDVDAHISLKPTQLGLDIDYTFCLNNLEEIVDRASKYNIHVNIDMEDNSHLQPSFDLLDELSRNYDNVGTVIQAYFYRAEEDIQKYKNFRLRIVKGAYKEPKEFAYQEKKEIDENFIKLIEWHLLNGKFTSIATHDHNIINHVKKFVKANNIPNDKFEFQMLYGFRREMQLQLASEGYNFCTYVPFGSDWYGYFMRRLAERPQNLNLVVKQVFNKKTNTVIGVAAGAFLLGRLTKKNKKK
ncbi:MULTISPECIES: proline dehydrogenase family protein [Heyndrickxia]|uniref:proline dehydrogenase n=1 Tax=Heyndrickxia sporothermodurans TaxID=46224 RepID=A0A150KKX6_9BACI|nr:proline dehydrogenase family protein [Heyndrickxia sporothermodurans]KYC90331.1 Proline dehydrogenase (Proline oxidase) [Heyndrickxia sporothermodurans]MBL5771058.1 proline dehydrogenase family protein [Heyndrickxia sporothermodurans]MBL5774727.1 proline dehydrogenase family protein [Heyndrickxia sporothermodurans]MBL5785432.1 proline dehydrogenase family protein [Heyndrickxia sporothermodurans]MBL5788919.1 proline dehydrogenase family protein [Heyndrickxia sporothermodurans]